MFDIDNEENNCIEDTIKRDSFQDKIRRASFAVKKAMSEEFNMIGEADSSDSDDMASSQSLSSDFMDDNKDVSV